MHLVRSLLFAGALFTASSVSGADRPNIIFILADDLGWTDLGCQGSTYYETPHIDRLARGGLRFDAFYMSQNCAPTRACLMSGQYAPRTGLYTVSTLERGKAEDRRMHVPKNETLLTLKVKTVADVLKSAGYATGMFGKWHLGHEQGFHPADRGFDEALRSNGRHFKIRTDPPTDVPEDQYFADWLTERGVDFIARHRDESFFLYLPHFAVHSPYQAKDEYVKRWESEPGVGGHNNPVYAAMIQSVDESVGAVMAALERHGIADNTLVIFSSDNGGIGSYYATEPPAKKRGITDNAPLRGGKGTLYEGGIRVPFIARWPRSVPAGSTTAIPGVHVDILPTFADLAGAPLPDQPLDGVSLVPVLKAPATAKLGRDAIHHHFPGYLESYVHDRGWRTTPVSVIREGNFKLLEFHEDDRIELYDLAADIGERADLATSRPEKALALRRKLAEWRISLDAAMPTRKK